ncbi:hypothetical protein MMC24_007110 [Lignoscripta atroalba]|nr:hypothetical protein [Lignoscripta atroalba]
MTPPVELFPTWELEHRVQGTAQGKRRKPPVKLEECTLGEMVQYNCYPETGGRESSKPIIKCEPIVRLFRRCASGLTVETTALEGRRASQKSFG